MMRLRNRETGETGCLFIAKNENYNFLDEDGNVYAVIDALYKEVKDDCELRETRAVMVEGINIVEEK